MYVAVCMSVRVSVCVWQSAGPVCVAVCRACVCGSLQGLCVWQSAGPVCVAVCRACVCGSLQGLCVWQSAGPVCVAVCRACVFRCLHIKALPPGDVSCVLLKQASRLHVLWSYRGSPPPQPPPPPPPLSYM